MALEAVMVDAETKAAERPRDHKDELRLWLRLLTCTTLVEGEIRRRMRERFEVTLPRFDLMAQLEKASDGMTLGEISRRMMVSNGNVTGPVERLVAQGLVERVSQRKDRRAVCIRLTEAGRRSFAEMARAHEAWIAELFGDLSEAEISSALALLAKTKRSVHRSLGGVE